jgi:hypothetical protein
MARINRIDFESMLRLRSIFLIMFIISLLLISFIISSCDTRYKEPPVYNQNPDECPNYDDTFTRETCYSNAAKTLDDAAYCKKIIGKSPSSYKIKKDCFFFVADANSDVNTCIEMDNWELSNSCLAMLATKRADLSFCNNVTNYNTKISSYNNEKEFCYAQVINSNKGVIEKKVADQDMSFCSAENVEQSLCLYKVSDILGIPELCEYAGDYKDKCQGRFDYYKERIFLASISIDSVVGFGPAPGPNKT